MSAVFNSYTKYLTASLATSLAAADNKLVTAWVKWNSAESRNSINHAVQLANAAGASPGTWLRLLTTNTPNFEPSVHYGDGSGSTTVAAHSSDVWTLFGLYIDGNNGVNYRGVRGYLDSVTNGGVAGVPPSANTDPFAYLTIGTGGNFGSYTQWKGKVAEVAIWEPTDSTQADAIIAELLTKKPDTISTATPIWYASLESDASVSIGSALTNNGTTTFDAGDHPSLSGGSTAPTLTSPTGTAIGTTTATIGATTDTATGTLYGYVSTSATPPSAANLKAGTGATWSGSVAVSSTGAKTLSATGLTAATGYYAHLIHTDGSANDSNIVTSAQFTTNALTKKLKLLAHADAQGDSGVAGVVFDAPTGSNITGPNKIGEFTGKTFEASLEGGKAVLKVPVADFGGSALTTLDTPVALVRNATNTTGIISCTVIEE